MSHSTREAAVLFADVSGSTRLYEALGNVKALESVERCLHIMREVTHNHSGRVIKTIGDEVMALFPNADTSLMAASEIQTKISVLEPVANNVRLAVRIGFHYGSVIEEGNDIFGDVVNIASRLAGLAKAGQIITTKETVSFLSAFLQLTARNLNLMTLKGKANDIHVCEIIWQQNSETTMMAGQTASSLKQAQLHLIYKGHTLYMNQEKSLVVMGRDPTSDLIIDDKKASRLHAKIERRRDKFVLIDQSTNGSYVKVNNDEEMVLHREEMILRAQGAISFGHSINDPEAEVVKFFCE